MLMALVEVGLLARACSCPLVGMMVGAASIVLAANGVTSYIVDGWHLWLPGHLAGVCVAVHACGEVEGCLLYTGLV